MINKKPKYCLFYDNHTMKDCPDVGAEFDVEEFTGRIADCGVDFITFHARCNQGFSYYDTDLGIKHPSLEYDLFKQVIESANKKGIAVSAYLNGGISYEEGLQHRDWTTLYFDGRTYQENRVSPYVSTMCYNSGYRDHLLSMVKEIASKYPVAGFFIDCMNPFPCICPTCIEGMKNQGIDWQDIDEVKKFSEQSVLRLARDISELAKSINPDFLLYFNGPGFEDQADSATYFECECLPTNPGMGYGYLALLSHYMRNIKPDLPVLNMTGRFYDWGDFGGLRPQAGLEYDLLYGLANCMRPNIGGHFHPRGTVNHAVFDRIEKIYRKLQQFEPWFNDAQAVTEIAICFPKDIHAIRGATELRGIVGMLCELNMQFDVVSEDCDWTKYQVLILPDTIQLSEKNAQRVKEHIDAGKSIISSAWSGLNTEKIAFALPAEWGVSYKGDCSIEPPYFSATKDYSKNLPDMPLALYQKGTKITALEGTKIEAKIIAPYYNQHWDGERAYTYLPPDKMTDQPMLCINSNVAHFSHPIFTAYFDTASVELRQIFANVLENLLPQPIIKVEGMPTFGKVFVTQQTKRTIVHMLTYVPELRGRIQMIEEPVTVKDIRLSLRMDKNKIPKVYSAPEQKELSFKKRENYIEVNIEEVHGYSMIVFEHD